jgi:XTP/dITP diphosphohydrolase
MYHLAVSELVVATNNRGKLAEIQAVMQPFGIQVSGVGRYAAGFDPEETGETFLDNAVIKVLAAWKATGRTCASDDSGLCVEALNMRPGVQSARYGGPGLSDEDRVRLLLGEMSSREVGQRKAFFLCCVAAVVPRGDVRSTGNASVLDCPDLPDPWMLLTTEARVPGSIALAPSGQGGFGYDPVFIPDAFPHRTMAELDMDDKNAISHRGQAFTALALTFRA